jgi:hypothetical protein
MFRKTILAAATVATIAATALVPTTASAKYLKGGFGWGGPYWGYGYGAGFLIAAPLVYGTSCVRYMENRFGQLVRVYVC